METSETLIEVKKCMSGVPPYKKASCSPFVLKREKLVKRR